MLLATLGVFAYIFSAAALLKLFFSQKKIPLKLAVSPGVVALICHLIYINSYFALDDANSYNLLLVGNLISLVVAFIALGFAQQFHNYFVVPICFILTALMLAASLVVPSNIDTVAHWSIETLSHIGLALLAYAVLTIATLMAFQYNYVSSKLKTHDLSILTLPLPPLNTIEKQVYSLLTLGNVLLTLSIATGAVFLDNFFGSGQAHKAILSIIAWVCFTTLLVGHAKFGWRGHVTLGLTVAGSTLLTIGYFGSRFIHDFLV